MTLPLFDPAPGFDRRGLGEKLRALALEGIWIGGSSWKYEGWLDQIYTRERYLSRGRFSQKRFEAECLAEYAEIFPIVCGDFSFYQFPTAEFWRKLFGSAPASLRYALKVPEEVTCDVFPRHARYGPRAGMQNESFLNAELLKAMFLEPLEPYCQRVSALIFEFGARSTPPREFVAQLAPFLKQLPTDFQYSVEVRNRTYLEPNYFECLREHNIAHVFNSWTKMPPLTEQIAIDDAYTADFTVVRALLRPGRPYEQAVERFSPYKEVVDPYPEGRNAVRDLIRRMREEKRAALVFVNNRFEGNAPKTIEAIVSD